MSVAPTWECERSVDVDVPVWFAWTYMTDIRNWNDPPAEFAIEGPFVEGTRGTTRMPGRPLALWTIRHVDPRRTIEGSLERAPSPTGDWIRVSERTARSRNGWNCSVIIRRSSTRSNRRSSRTWSPT